MPLKRSIAPEKHYKRTVPGAEVYLDDIEVIVAAMEKASVEAHRDMDAAFASKYSELSAEERDQLTQLMGKLPPSSPEDGEVHRCVEIRAGSAVADNSHDLKDATPEELADVQIAVSHPFVTVTLARSVSYIWAVARDPGGRELADSIGDYLAERRSVRASLAVGVRNLWVFLVAGAVLGAASFLSAEEQSLGQLLVSAIPFTLMSLTLVMYVFYKNRTFGGALVHPRRRSEARRLSGQQKQGIGIALVSAVAGGVATGVFELWGGS